MNDFAPVEEPPAGPWYKSPDLVRPLLRNLGAWASPASCFSSWSSARFSGWTLKPEKAAEISQFPRTVAEIEAANKEEGLLSLTKSAGVLEEVQPLEKKRRGRAEKAHPRSARLKRRKKVSASCRTGLRRGTQRAGRGGRLVSNNRDLRMLKAKKVALSGIEKTAILMNVIGAEKNPFELMKGMKDPDVRKLLKVMGNMKKAPIGIINSVLREFLYRLSEKEEIIFDQNLPPEPELVSAGARRRARQTDLRNTEDREPGAAQASFRAGRGGYQVAGRVPGGRAPANDRLGGRAS